MSVKLAVIFWADFERQKNCIQDSEENPKDVVKVFSAIPLLANHFSIFAVKNNTVLVMGTTVLFIFPRFKIFDEFQSISIEVSALKRLITLSGESGRDLRFLKN